MSALLAACAPQGHGPAQVSFRVRTPGLGLYVSALTGVGGSDFEVSNDFCYALHVTGDAPELNRLAASPAEQACSRGPQGLGLLKGLFGKGETASLTVPVGKQRKFDLVGFPKSALPGGNCRGALAAEAVEGKAQLTLDGAVYAKRAQLIASGLSDINEGDNVITLVTATEAAAGVPYTCTDLPKVTLLPGGVVNSVNAAAYPVAGTCSEEGRPVKLSFVPAPASAGAASAAAAPEAPSLCVSGRWQGALNLSALTDGAIVIRAELSDAAGNAAAPASITVNKATVFTVGLSSPASAATNLAAIPVRVTFSRVVTGLAAADFSVTNGSAGGLAGSGAIYDFQVMPLSNGPVTVGLAAGAVQDGDGNPNPAASSLSFVYDNALPGVTLSTAVTTPTNLGAIAVTATFSEPVTGLAPSGLSLTNGTVDGLAGSGTVYTFNLHPAANGPVRVNVSAGAAQDAAGNGNAASGNLSLTFDNVAPTLALAPSVTSPTNTGSWTYTATFSEPVADFAAPDVVVGNGALSGFTGSGSAYSFTVTPSADGPVTVTVGAAAAHDAAGNASIAASNSVVYDTLPPGSPSVIIQGGAPYTNLTNVTLALAATGAAAYALAPDTSTCAATSAWVAMSPSAAYAITGGASGSRTVYAKFKDAAGNVTTCVSDSIGYDATPPAFNAGTTSFDLVFGESQSVQLPLATDDSTPVHYNYPGSSVLTGCAPDGSSHIVCTLNGTAAGLYTLGVIAEDDAFNAVTLSVQVKVYPKLDVGTYGSLGAYTPFWNDHLFGGNSGSALCTGSESGVVACLHLGSHRRVSVTPAAGSCAGLKLTDELNIFDWQCQGSDFLGTLKNGKGLKDLVNGLPTPGWKTNRVELRDGGNQILAKSHELAWWGNPVIELPDDATTGTGVILLPAGGDSQQAIYTVSNSRTTDRGYQVQGGVRGLSIVTLSGAILTGGSGLPSCSGGANCLIQTTSGNYFLWFEGAYQGNALSSGVVFYLPQVKYSNLWQLHVSQGSQGGSNGVLLANGASFNRLTGLRLVNNGFGVKLNNGVMGNVLSNINAYGNSNGVYLNSANDNVLANIVAASNNAGISMTETAVHNTFVRITALNNSGPGLALGGVSGSASYHRVVNALAVNNSTGFGFGVTSSVAAQIAVAHNGTGVSIPGGGGGGFIDQFLYGPSNGSSCNVSAGLTAAPLQPGASCAPQGGSSFSGITSFVYTGAYAGTALADTVNPAAAGAGTQAFSNINNFGWFSFQNPMRLWGLNYPGLSSPARGSCTTGTCAVWDLTPTALQFLTANDTDACPAMVMGSQSINSSISPLNFVGLRNGLEVLGDGIGNDDGVCEANEACWAMPNTLGAYLPPPGGQLGTCVYSAGGGPANVKIQGYR